MRLGITAPHVLRLAMAVCACGLPLVAQNGVEKSFSASPAEKNPVLHGADDIPLPSRRARTGGSQSWTRWVSSSFTPAWIGSRS